MNQANDQMSQHHEDDIKAEVHSNVVLSPVHQTVNAVPATSILNQSLERRLSLRSTKLASSALSANHSKEELDVSKTSPLSGHLLNGQRGLIPIDRLVLPEKCQPLVDVSSDNEFEDVFLPSSRNDASSSRFSSAVRSVEKRNAPGSHEKKQLLLKDGFEFDLLASMSDEDDAIFEVAETAAAKGKRSRHKKSPGKAVKPEQRQSSGLVDGDFDDGEDLDLIPPHNFIDSGPGVFKTCMDSAASGFCIPNLTGSKQCTIL